MVNSNIELVKEPIIYVPFFESGIHTWTIERIPFAIALPKEFSKVVSPYIDRGLPRFYLYIKSEPRRIGPVSIEEANQIVLKLLNNA